MLNPGDTSTLTRHCCHPDPRPQMCPHLWDSSSGPPASYSTVTQTSSFPFITQGISNSLDGKGSPRSSVCWAGNPSFFGLN